MSNEPIEYEIGSGNVFADLGLANPKERQLKAQLASMIYDIITSRGWTQQHTADVLEISQPDVSKMSNGILKNFSVERLLEFLAKLEQRVTITIDDEQNKLPSQKIVIASNQVAV